MPDEVILKDSQEPVKDESEEEHEEEHEEEQEETPTAEPPTTPTDQTTDQPVTLEAIAKRLEVLEGKTDEALRRVKSPIVKKKKLIVRLPEEEPEEPEQPKPRSRREQRRRRVF